MNDSLAEKLKVAKKANETAYVSFFNDGTVGTDEYSTIDRMSWYWLDDTLSGIEYVLCSGTESFARNCSFDTIELGLKLGLVYNKEDVDDENHVKEGAKPLDGIVRCYTKNLSSYLDGEQSNEKDYYNYSRQGFAEYKKIVSRMRKNGVEFTGPATFEEFKNAILAGEQFDVSVIAKFNKKNNQQELTEEPEEIVPETKKETSNSKIKRLIFPFRKNRS